MSKVTSKLQVTVPKAIAEQYRIRPGDEISWHPAGAVIQVRPARERGVSLTLETRIKLFDAATTRQRSRQRRPPRRQRATDRGWRREDLYDRAGPR